MRVTVVGGGPGGLYCALLLKKSDPSREVTVLERDPRDATYGFGVVFSDRTLASLRAADRESYDAITGAFVTWETIEIRYRGEILRCGGHVFAGVERRRLLGILQGRAASLGVDLRFERDVHDPTAVGDADLIVAADGVSSLFRRTYARAFGPHLDTGAAKYIWLASDRHLDAFTFIYRASEHGLFTAHCYPYGPSASTFIVECDEETWRNAGLDRATERESLAYCERLLAPDLEGHALISNRSAWISFVTVRNRRWRHGNVALLGDAAHTAHFSIGSGTKLAMDDAIALAYAFSRTDDVDLALASYESERRPAIAAFQRAAAESRTYFEHTKMHVGLEPRRFAFQLLTRSGRISYEDLRSRDEAFVAALGEPETFTPIRIRGLVLRDRLAVRAETLEAARDGLIREDGSAALARSGAALVLSELVAVSADGRLSPGSPGLWRDDQVAAWSRAIAAAKARGSAVALRLVHAGRRGAVRPRREGVDRPLRSDAWPLLAASARPYTPRSATPRAITTADLERVRDDFAAAARRAIATGADVVELVLAQGYLVADFLSPLTNRRDDEYGHDRLRFALEVVDAVRSEWTGPLAVALTADDHAPGGAAVEDAIATARALREHGCDIVHVHSGGTVADAEPPYGRRYLTALSDRIRNEGGVPTMVGGHVASLDDAHTILVAGRADLVVLDAAYYVPAKPGGAGRSDITA